MAVAGAGGKTSLILRLAGELREARRRVVVTTTTKMRVSETLPGSRTLLGDVGEGLRRGIEDAFDAGAVPFVFSGTEAGKRTGLASDSVDALAGPDRVVLVEADGARGAPLKVPRPFEPVVPESTDLYIIVMGGEAVGRPVDSNTVFNLEAAASAPTPGETVTIERAASLVQGTGFLRHARPERRTMVFVNRADALEERDLRALCERLGHGTIDRIVTGCARDVAHPLRVFDNRCLNVGALLLAAGASKRFGAPKLTLPAGGRPLVARVVEAVLAGGVDQAVVVTGCDSETVQSALAGTADLRFAENPRHREGMSTSLQAGLEAMADFDAALVLPADLPGMTAALVDSVLQGFHEGTAPLCYPHAVDRHGHPVVFRRDLWPELAAVRGDEGGRSVLLRHRDRAKTVPLDDPNTQVDIDTPEAYERWRRS